MRISDWSSDVCSSDLVLPAYVARTAPELVPILPSEISLTRSYWMVADTDIAETAQIRLTLRFLRGLMAEAGDLFTRTPDRSEEHTSELQSLMRISYAVFCLKKKKK